MQEEENCVNDEDCMPGGMKNEPNRNDQDEVQKPRQKNWRAMQQDMDNSDQGNRTWDRQANKNWHFDPNKHHRSWHKDSRFRFYHGGYWYLEPY